MSEGEAQPPRAHRLHQGGRLSFRRRVRQRGAAPAGLDLPLIVGGEDPPPLDELVPDGFDRVEIEIGPGKGAFVVAATEAKPDTFVLGIEAAPAYASLAAQRLAATGRTNGLLLVDNGKLYLEDRVPDASLDALHVYYPDPWPKRRHRGRRFFTDDVVPTLRRVLKADGLLLVATDNAAYAGQICVVLGASPLFVRDLDAERRLLAAPGHGFSPTNFERKYVLEGRVLRRYAWRPQG